MDRKLKLYKKDLTLIIPCHNLERYLTPLLSTLQNQELHDLKVEILFICDNCTDNTIYILDDWRNKTPQYEVYIFETSYSRAGLARNFGLERAQGEYLWFIDGDDWLIGEDAILTAYYNIDSRPNLSFLRFNFLSTWCPKPEFENTVVWRFIFRTDFVRQFKFNDKLNNEDVDFLN